jgi:uncharacterized protein YyaL (SSP411 family)
MPSQEEELEDIRRILLTARSKRVPPATDTKILVGWTALMVSGLAWAAEALHQARRSSSAQRARQWAQQAFEFIQSQCREGDRLYSTYQGGRPRFAGYLDDYAYVIQAAIDLARFETQEQSFHLWVKTASELARSVIQHFRDEKGPGYFFTADDHEQLLQRPKDIADGALPSGNAVFLEALLWLAELDEAHGAQFSKEAEVQFHGLGGYARDHAFGCTESLSAYLLREIGPVTLAGSLSNGEVARGWFHVLRKPGEGQWVLCHQQVCDTPQAAVAPLRTRIVSVLRSDSASATA